MRKSGYVAPSLAISRKELVENNLYLNYFYDDWEDWRDGMRDWYTDFKTIKKIDIAKRKIYGERYEKRIRMNQKQQKLLKIRKERKL